MQTFGAAGAGFLLAVLWFDLMFDIQVWRREGSEVPEPVLASISAYYKRVTTDARPMNRLVSAVMVVTIASTLAEVLRHGGAHWAAWVSLALVISAVVLAGARVVPRAIRLGTRRDPLPVQSALSRSIFRDHLACLAAVASLLVVQLAWAR